MKFEADSYFTIGELHSNIGEPCQDYSIAESFGDDLISIAVSDGCSSGRRTDVGARLVALFGLLGVADNYSKSFCDYVHGLINKMILNENDLLATSLSVEAAHYGANVYLKGDGVIVLKYANKTELIRVDWEDNMPFYPIYYYGNMLNFIAAHGGDLKAERVTIKRSVFSDSGPDYHQLVKKSLENGVEGEQIGITPIELLNLDYIALFSDGICQIEGLDWKDAALQSLDYKSTKGVFVKRRMNKLMKEWKKAGHRVMDDLSCAVIKVIHD